MASRDAVASNLLDLQFGLEFFARIPGADGLDRALFPVLFSPDFLVLCHVRLGKAVSATGFGRKAPDGLGLHILQKYDCA